MAFPTVAFSTLAAVLFASASLAQESVVPAPPRVPLPRPVANAPMAQVNDNRRAAGTLSGRTLTLSLDIVEAAYQPKANTIPSCASWRSPSRGRRRRCRARCFARRWDDGATHAAQPLRLRGHARRSPSLDAGRSRHGARRAGATREITFRLDRVGNFFYWARAQGPLHLRRSLLARLAAHRRVRRRLGRRAAAVGAGARLADHRVVPSSFRRRATSNRR